MASTIPHRYVTPSYPGAAGWDYFNVISGGQGGSGSAYMDNAKIGGPNAGSYAVCFGEDATSSNANRGLRALAQNCDYLDDLLHRNIASKIRTSDAVAGAPVGSITLPVSTFLGVAGTPNSTAGYEVLFSITDGSDNEIIDPGTGAKVQVTAVVLGAGDQIGGGGANGNFSGNTVGLTLSPVIPAGTTYRVYYGTRTNLAELPLDALTSITIRGAQEVEAVVENLFRLLHGNNLSWNAAWTSTVYDLAISGLDDRYSRRTAAAAQAASPPESYWPTTLNVAGAGGWIRREGPALTVYSFGDDVGAYVDPLNALFAAKFDDTLAFDSAGIVGYAVYGSRKSGSATIGESAFEPGAASFLALWPHHTQNTIHATNPLTRILEWATASFSSVGAYSLNTGEAIVTVTQAGNYFRTAGGLSAVAVGYDLLECTYTIGGQPQREIYVIVGMGASNDASNVAKVRVRRLDGAVPDFSTNPTGTIRWISMTFGVGDGAGRYHKTLHGYADTQAILFDGLFYQVPPSLSANAGDDNIVRVPPSFSAQANTAASKALQWGGFRQSQPSGPVFSGSFLQGDGGISVIGADVTASGSANTAGAVKGNYVILNSVAPGAGVTNIGPLVGPGPYVATYNVALGSYRYVTIADLATGNLNGHDLRVNVTNPRLGGLMVFTLDHSVYTTGAGVTMDWTNAGTSTVTNRFAPGDDQPAPGGGRTMWIGMPVSATEVWWSVTRL